MKEDSKINMKRKAIVALYGISNQGKSETIKLIYSLIKTAYPRAIFNEIFIGGDIKVIVTIGKIKIGIESQGDPGSRMSQSLIDFDSASCDIIICATRTSGTTVDTVSSYHKKGYDIIWATNYISYEKPHTQLNQISAEQIFELIQKLMSGWI